MDVKEVVGFAKQELLEIFGDENISNVGLEEVKYDESEREWYVTLGFSRPWDYDRSRAAVAVLAGKEEPPKRVYKKLRISDGFHKVLSISDL